MNKKYILLICILMMIQNFSTAQTTIWKNKKCAVVLTYDDAINEDLSHAIPALDSVGLKATFYLTASSPGFKDHLKEWRNAAAKGHELGNHTLFHPCVGNNTDRSWVSQDYNLSTYTLRRLEDEIKMNNVILATIDGKTKRTFAYPCGDVTVGDTSYVETIKDDFIAARGVHGMIQTAKEIDLFNVGAYGINGQTGDELINLVKEAISKKGLIVFLFHGVGGGHSLNVSLKAHHQLLRFLKQNEKEIWTTTFIEAVEVVKVAQAK
ncbi:MAG TPA: polysaccharide deacetylase family protein [Cyclobacteriaceae bacterium]|jgi:peptidoglycan/xylan/chitin deacetylase (PgdA/CDA1 family)|nr:polysaccharide deacetylase family protein [Cyclobacteriaceae bacterium]